MEQSESKSEKNGTPSPPKIKEIHLQNEQDYTFTHYCQKLRIVFGCGPFGPSDPSQNVFQEEIVSH